MLPQPKSPSDRQEIAPDPLAHPDLVLALEQQLDAGFPSALALDLVLNELVVRAATATRAAAAALALKRGDEMVCRAATGQHAPDLGIALNTSDGVSGACLRTRRSQLCLDTETDPRVDAATCRRQGIRSMLVVPILDEHEDEDQLVGVLEVFSAQPAEFVDSDQNLLEIFARECNRIRRAALRVSDQPTALAIKRSPILEGAPEFTFAPSPGRRSGYEGWTLALGALAIALIIAFSFMIGSRIGWLGMTPVPNQGSPPPSTVAVPQSAAASSSLARPSQNSKPAATSAVSGNANELVVYEQGKVIFRMKPAPVKRSTEDAGAISTDTPAGIARVWLAADLAESRLVHRVEPQYPAEAQAAHRTGDVVIEVLVNPDGTVGSTRPLRGDPLLAIAAVDAVRSWRYEPYRVKGQPSEFQTDVTLRFSLPD